MNIKPSVDKSILHDRSSSKLIDVVRSHVKGSGCLSRKHIKNATRVESVCSPHGRNTRSPQVAFVTHHDSGFEEPSLTIQKGHGFDKVVNVDYDPKRDSLTIEYNHHKSQNCFTKMRFMEPPDNIDLVTRRIPEEMRLRWEEAVKSKNTKEMGNIGAEVATKIAEKEYDVKVPLSGKTTGPDGDMTINREPGVFEAKSGLKLVLRE